MSQLRKILDRILNVLAGVSFLAMVALTCWQVFTRYILKNPSSWSEEMVSYLFGWMALLGASIAEVIGCLFAMVILVFGGVQITSLAMGQMTSSLGVPVGVFYIVLPLSGVLNIIYTVINIVEIVNGTIDLHHQEESGEKKGKEA